MKIGGNFVCKIFDRNSYLIEITKTTFLYIKLFMSHVTELFDTWKGNQAIHQAFENVV